MAPANGFVRSFFHVPEAINTYLAGFHTEFLVGVGKLCNKAPSLPLFLALMGFGS